MSVEELTNYIKQELKGCNGYAFIDRALNEMQALIAQQKAFNCDKFVEWFRSRNVAYKNNPISFLTKCGFEDIRNGHFNDNYAIRKEKAVFCIQYLFNSLRENNIEVLPEDTLFIDYVETYILNYAFMDIIELADWNRKAIEYLKNKGKTTKDFIYLFRNTRSMRAMNIPLKQIEEEVKELNREFEEMFKGSNNVEPKKETTAMVKDDVKSFIESEIITDEEK